MWLKLFVEPMGVKCSALSKVIETDNFARCGFLQNFYEKIECRQIWQGKSILIYTHTHKKLQ